MVSGGTDNHMMLGDLSPLDVSGRDAEKALEETGLACNKNQIPYDPRPPRVCSGIRLGTPPLTTRGMGVAEMQQVGALIVRVLRHMGDAEALAEVRRRTLELAHAFPVPPSPECCNSQSEKNVRAMSSERRPFSCACLLRRMLQHQRAPQPVRIVAMRPSRLPRSSGRVVRMFTVRDDTIARLWAQPRRRHPPWKRGVHAPGCTR